ncbi:MAG: hypothetical protein GY820_10025 [Gammaproteobacteria bacterium]|nr:hypothetical protein [Gammaproteobacteria bacterium]
MINKYFILTASLVFSIGMQSASAIEYLCDGKDYGQLLAAQQDTEGNLVGTQYDGCRNFKAVSRDKYYQAGGAPIEVAAGYMAGDAYVGVYEDSSDNGEQHWWLFYPNGSTTQNLKNAVLFVPGANVDSSAYSPLAYNLVRQLTAKGEPTIVFITRYPAFQYGTEKPCNVLTNDIETLTITSAHEKYSTASNNSEGIQIENWVVGGHSEGGEGMSEYLRKLELLDLLPEKKIKGAFWLASYPSNTAHNIPSTFCSLGIAGGDDLGLNQQTWIDKKTNGDFPPRTIYYDFQNGFTNGIHSYLGSYCPLTPGPSPQDPVLSGELKYYEVEPDPTVHPLQITRAKQDQIIFGTGNVGDIGVVGNFAYQALTGDYNACQTPLTVTDTFSVTHTSADDSWTSAGSLPPLSINIAGTQTIAGLDTFDIRMKLAANSIVTKVKLQEETSSTAETGHNVEDVDIINAPFGKLINDLGVQVGHTGGNVIDQDGHSMYFNSPGYVVVAQVKTSNGSSPVRTIVKTNTGSSHPEYNISLAEWDYLNGIHSEESVDYIVIEPGVHTLEDGTQIAAGFVDYSSGQQLPLTSTVDISSYGFTQTPTVVTTPHYDELLGDPSYAYNARAYSVSSSSFELRIDTEEARRGETFITPVRVAWVAVLTP